MYLSRETRLSLRRVLETERVMSGGEETDNLRLIILALLHDIEELERQDKNQIGGIEGPLLSLLRLISKDPGAITEEHLRAISNSAQELTAIAGTVCYLESLLHSLHESSKPLPDEEGTIQ